MRKLWRWLRDESGIRFHGVCYAAAILSVIADRWGVATFTMALAVYWLIYDTPRATVTIHAHDCLGGKLTVVADPAPTSPEQEGER